MVLHGRARPGAGNFVVIERPGIHTLDGMFMAAAAMALADGVADPVEYASFTRFLRRTELLCVLGRRATAARFATAIDRVASAPDPILAQRLRPRANTAGARLIVRAAVWVAVADGVLHPQERTLFRLIMSVLGLTAAAVPEGPRTEDVADIIGEFGFDASVGPDHDLRMLLCQ